MGSDIQCFLEEKIDGIWYFRPYSLGEYGADFWSNRSYSTFAWLKKCGRCTHITPLVKENCTIPNDTCQEIKDNYESWKGDAHNLGVATFTSIINRLNEEYVICKKDYCITKTKVKTVEIVSECFIKRVKHFSKNKNLENLRLIFWFDN